MSMLSGTYCQALFLAFENTCNVATMQIFSLLAPQALVLSSGHLRMGRECHLRSLAAFKWWSQLSKDGFLLPLVFGRSLGLLKGAET